MIDPQISPLRQALASPDAEERRQATARLGQLALDVALPLLVQALGDEDWRVRKEATLVTRPLAAAPALIAAMIETFSTSHDVGLRNAAIDVLIGAGAAATTALAAALPKLDADGRKLAVEVLGRGRDPVALGALAQVLAGDADENVRQAAMEAVAQLGVIARERAGELLLASLDDRDLLVRFAALSGLCALELPVPWHRLRALLDEPILRTLALAAAALSDSPEAVAALVQALDGARGEAFGEALSALGRLAIGPYHDEVRRALRGSALGERLTALALDRALPTERRATALILAAAALAPRAAQAAFACLSEELLADTARRALREIGAAALPSLLATLADAEASASTRAELIRVIGEMVEDTPEIEGDPALLAALRASLDDPDPHVVTSALSTLAPLGGAEDLDPVAALTLSDVRPIAHAAGAALAALCQRDPPAARVHAARMAEDAARFLPAVIELGALAAAGLQDPGTAVFLAQVAATGNTAARRAAVLAAAELDGPLTLEVLRIALTDEEHEVQLAAARALGHRVASASALSPVEMLDPVERSGEIDLLAAAVRAMGERLSFAQAERRSAPPPTPELIGALARYARRAQSPVALAAVDSLGQALAFGRAASYALAAALEHPTSSVARAAAFKLGESPVGQEALIEALAHPSPAVCVLVAEMLLDIDLPDARDRLVRRVAVEADGMVREAIEQVLGATSRGADSSPRSRRGESSNPPGEGRR
ncbi:MAG: HEAT repeat domain-containing protein [Minicystis sp.]